MGKSCMCVKSLNKPERFKCRELLLDCSAEKPGKLSPVKALGANRSGADASFQSNHIRHRRAPAARRPYHNLRSSMAVTGLSDPPGLCQALRQLLVLFWPRERPTRA